MLTKFIEGIGWVVKTVWNLGVAVPRKVYEAIAVGLILLGIFGVCH